jgi:hypothetical protein
MARTPEQRDALARLEYLVDPEMAARPYAALCGYDTGQLSTAAAELVCLHPFVGKGSVPVSDLCRSGRRRTFRVDR